MLDMIDAGSVVDRSQLATLDAVAVLCKFAQCIQKGFFDAEQNLRLELAESGAKKNSTVWTSKLAIRINKVEVTTDKRCPDLLNEKYVKLAFVRRRMKGYSDRVPLINGKFNADQIIGSEINRVSKDFEQIVRQYVKYVNHHNVLIFDAKESLVRSALTSYHVNEAFSDEQFKSLVEKEEYIQNPSATFVGRN